MAKDSRGKHDDSLGGNKRSRETGRAGRSSGRTGRAQSRPYTEKGKGGGYGQGPPDPPKHGGKGGDSN